ncbi:MAG TPA: hypothetical protein VK171_05475 [Fimbriimonas sp.]|nr:hypothetical protein [Fimbriimonas sp.]
MSDQTSKTSKSDRISELVIKVDAMREANPFMGIKAACGLVGLSKDTYYLRKRAIAQAKAAAAQGRYE